MPILEARDVHYAYETHRVLRGVSLALERGKLYAILGPSGCGKTTLLSLLGGLDSPTQGQILFDGEDIAQHGLARHRRDHVSFVFQAPPPPPLRTAGADARGGPAADRHPFRGAAAAGGHRPGFGLPGAGHSRG